MKKLKKSLLNGVLAYIVANLLDGLLLFFTGTSISDFVMNMVASIFR